MKWSTWIAVVLIGAGTLNVISAISRSGAILIALGLLVYAVHGLIRSTP